MTPSDQALLLMALFSAKHFLGDYPLQTYAMTINKGIYMHPDGLLHASIHGLLSILLLAAAEATFLEFPLGIGVALVIAEWMVHYHVDWAKLKVNDRFGWTMKDDEFWWMFGFDQLLHALTYVGMVRVLV